MAQELAPQNVDPMKTFQDRVEKKIREDIAATLPDEVIESLIKKAVDDTFFKERVIKPSDIYGRETKGPSWFIEAVVKAAKPILEAKVEEYIKTHQDLIDAALADFFSPANLTLFAVDRFSDRVRIALDIFSNQIMNMPRH